MARSSFQKLKIIYVMEYLLKYSDEEHPVTTNQIIAYLQSHDIAAERKSGSNFIPTEKPVITGFLKP